MNIPLLEFPYTLQTLFRVYGDHRQLWMRRIYPFGPIAQGPGLKRLSINGASWLTPLKYDR